MFRLPMFGIPLLAFLMILLIIAIATYLVFRSGEKGQTKLGGCAGCAIGLALLLAAGLGALGCTAVCLVGAKNEALRHGPVSSVSIHSGKGHEHGKKSASKPQSEWDKQAEANEAAADADPKHAVHLRIELRNQGDPAQITSWLREHTDGNFTLSVSTSGEGAAATTVVDIGLAMSSEEVDELRDELREALPSLDLPQSVKIELKGPND